jgi:hypothetical protein
MFNPRVRTQCRKVKVKYFVNNQRMPIDLTLALPLEASKVADSSGRVTLDVAV